MYEVNMDLRYKSYNILIEKGLFNKFGQIIKNVYKNKKIIILTDNNIEPIYGEALRKSFEKENFSIKIIVVPAGEESKSLRVLEKVYEGLLDAKASRSDLLITFGGGVIGDLGGFAAATYLRGIKFIQIPTTLLAQIDSSIGGKVAINLPKGKNLIGSFYHPELVLIDPELLRTLDNRFFYDGMAEVIKYGCIKESKLLCKLLEFDSINEMYSQIEEIIYTCCSIKKQLIEIDERDTGDRMLLNFGHTIGHGIEKYYNYAKYTHGEAIAIGMYNITNKSEELGFTKEGTTELLLSILEKYNLPYQLPSIDKSRLLNTIYLDKKMDSDYLNIILLKGIGESIIKRIHKDEIGLYL